MEFDDSVEELDVVTHTQGLRDFFLATNGAEIQAALERLNFYKHNKEAYNDKERLLKTEYAFNRLFVGPDKVISPPFASIYTEAEPALMGNSFQDIKELLDELGLGFENTSNLPLDHIGIELEIWLVLTNLCYALKGSIEQVEDAEEKKNLEELFVFAFEKHKWLVESHLPWIKKFIAQIDSTPKELLKILDQTPLEDIFTEEIMYIEACLESWLVTYVCEDYKFAGFTLT